jgi:hypothetical protein
MPADTRKAAGRADGTARVAKAEGRVNMTPSSTDCAAMPKLSLRWRIALWAALTFLLALGFAGYFMPGLRINWETIAAMCGF